MCDTFNGIIRSGKKHCKDWPDDLYALYKLNSGLVNLVRGSLNVELEFEYMISKADVTFTWNEIEIYLKQCQITFRDQKRLAFIMRNDVHKTHPINIIELISDIHFRTEWNLKDGDQVMVSI